VHLLSSETVPLSKRVQFRTETAYKNVISEEMVSKADVVADVAQYAARTLPDEISPEQLSYLIQANVHGSGVVTGMTNSIVAKASASGTYRAELAEDFLIPNNWEKALKDVRPIFWSKR
jgi:hypothetical protein